MSNNGESVEELHVCDVCGKKCTKEIGGELFIVCESCWDEEI